MTDTTRRVAAGAGWLYGFRWMERLLDAVAIVVLARILSPDDFGLVAIAASFIAIIEGLAAFDVNKALIRSRDEGRSLYDTAWTLSTVRGIAAASCMAAVALFVTDERIATVLVVLAVSPILSGLFNPRFVTFERDLVYSKLAALTLGAKLVSFAVTLGIAVVYRTYWALVLGIVANTLASTVLSYTLRPYRPRLSLARFPDIFAFSGWLSLTTIVTTLAMETDKIIVGRLLGVADAGLYFMTQRVGVLPTRELVSPLQRILFPSFSEIAHDEVRLRRVVRESINVLGSLSLPAGLGFALVANDFVPLVLGERWSPIVPLLVVLAPYLGVRATLSMTLPCLMALGQTRLLFWVSFAYALVHLPAFIAGTARFGLSGAIGSIVAAGALYIYLNAWMLKRTLGVSLVEVLVQLKRPLIAGSIMAGGVWLAPFASFSETGSWASLVSKGLTGAALFSGVQYALWRAQGRPAGIESRLAQLLSKA